MPSLSKTQFATLAVLELRTRSVGELVERWPGVLRTVKSLNRRGLVDVIPPATPLTAQREQLRAVLVRITPAGSRALGDSRNCATRRLVLLGEG